MEEVQTMQWPKEQTNKRSNNDLQTRKLKIEHNELTKDRVWTQMPLKG